MEIQIATIIRQLDEIQHKKIWLGETFSKKLDELEDQLAFHRPISTLHSVAELIAHLTTWKEEAILKIRTGKGSITDQSKRNWPEWDDLKKVGWPIIKSQYDRISGQLIQLLETKDDEFLDKLYYDNDYKGHYTYRFLLEGMIHHDLYHLGQLGIILKLASH